MHTSKSEETHAAKGNLRNFDLTVEEIRLSKTIENMVQMVSNIERLEPDSPRVKIIRNNIRKLKAKLEDVRENTLIR